MKIYIVKHKGKNWLGNMLLSSTMKIGKEEFYFDKMFYHKRDAEAYRKYYDNYNYWEVVGCELPESKQDNRKRI